MMGYAVSEEQVNLLNAALEALLTESEAQALFISDYGGNIITNVATDDDDSRETVAALAAGSFSATRELAGMIGENSFHSVFHKGDHSAIYIQCIAGDFIILAILGQGTSQGLAKLYIDKACKQIEPILLETSGQSVEAAAGGASERFEFKSDAVFETGS